MEALRVWRHWEEDLRMEGRPRDSKDMRFVTSAAEDARKLAARGMGIRGGIVDVVGFNVVTEHIFPHLALTSSRLSMVT